ncbi:MAG: radical SAM protein [Patescibacteria group bacterium]|nr:radical SAM protein [Patescibacteria group bacterium]MDE1945001.1 radical SAM protein [Patescibacteria group bacterium]MDE2057481.1 radical SAM protein [Patescibacteria group bacterium]
MTKVKWSDFHIRVPVDADSVAIKSTLTGAVVRMSVTDEAELERQLSGGEVTSAIQSLAQPEVGLLVSADRDEYAAWRERLVGRRNNEAHIFILHFLPTIQCQLACGYCFENGGDRMRGMSDKVIDATRLWLSNYLDQHPEIDAFRLVLFGGEPLLRKDIVEKGLVAAHSLAAERRLDFWTELVSNGELLDEATAEMLSTHQWLRVQITLDGPEDIHNARRPGKHGRQTFCNVIAAIKMLVSTDYIKKVDIRISLDHANADRIPELIEYLASLGAQDRMNLSLGLITPTLDRPARLRWDEERALGEKAVSIWAVAQAHGFAIPDEFVTGPWCVAIAKHAAILQPDGALQKCFCTAGRAEYDFGTVADTPGEYLRDERFESWRRTDQCIQERCAFLPICGGGCIHDAMVAAGGPGGGAERFCQKPLIKVYNEGLLKLNY